MAAGSRTDVAVLLEFHGVLQTAMGWRGYHLHMFDLDGMLYGDVEEIQGRPLGGDEQTYTVGDAVTAASEFEYEYDFGDSWTHDVRLERQLTSNGVPECVDGARACPPEDCGGAWGYRHLLEVLADPADPEHDEMLTWVGGEFDPAAVDLNAANELLAIVDRHTRRLRAQ